MKNIVYYITELWATQQTEKIDQDEQQEQYARTTLRELTIYMVFVGILTIGKYKKKSKFERLAFIFSRFWYGE